MRCCDLHKNIHDVLREKPVVAESRLYRVDRKKLHLFPCNLSTLNQFS